MNYSAIDLHKKKADVLIIHCSDPRFQAAYRQVIDSINVYFDLLVAPGASKAVVDDDSVIENIKLLHSFHHFEVVHILDHIECGAFGTVDDEIKSHSAMLARATGKIIAALPGLEIKTHLLGEKQELTVDDQG